MFRFQAYLFFPLLLLEAASLHIASVSALARRTSRPGTSHHGTFYRWAWEAGLFGVYLGSSFAPNHKGMPILDAADRTGFLRRQVLTSRNVRGGWLTDFALGGLNYQIEHHLFPSMPRPSLRRSQALVRAFCQQRDLAYCQTSLIDSYAQALRHLNSVGKSARLQQTPAL